ncbi:MAG: transposase [Flavobacteriaceae bacterium]|nr:transposase [Flavobacteriaceae bacterium]
MQSKATTPEQYDPYENAIAERINGILKQEFDIDKYDTDLKTKTDLVKNAIKIYNQIRPHLLYIDTKSNAYPKSIKNKKGSNIKSLPLIY